jgi:hypothetical protein
MSSGKNKIDLKFSMPTSSKPVFVVNNTKIFRAAHVKTSSKQSASNFDWSLN